MPLLPPYRIAFTYISTLIDKQAIPLKCNIKGSKGNSLFHTHLEESSLANVVSDIDVAGFEHDDFLEAFFFFEDYVLIQADSRFQVVQDVKDEVFVLLVLPGIQASDSLPQDTLDLSRKVDLLAFENGEVFQETFKESRKEKVLINSGLDIIRQLFKQLNIFRLSQSQITIVFPSILHMGFNGFSELPFQLDSLIIPADQVEESIELCRFFVFLVEIFHLLDHFSNVTDDDGERCISYQENQHADESLEIVLGRQITKANS